MATIASKVAPNTQAFSASRLERFDRVRQFSLDQVTPLSVEDMGLQAMANVSPPKWHLAHTSWFFETMVLEAFEPDFEPFNPLFRHLFNSYYETVGTFHRRDQRGLLSRPSVAEILDYRANIEQRLHQLSNNSDDQTWAEIADLVMLGTHHEQQHQELLFTDTLYNFSQNPMNPAYASPTTPSLGHIPNKSTDQPLALNYLRFDGGLQFIGNSNEQFCFDNETPRHQSFLQPFRLANRLITNGEYLTFIEAGGYQTAKHWLSDGWATIQNNNWLRPIYWQRSDSGWQQFGLLGLRPLNLLAPVCHLSYFEADAYARWAGKRLPSEAEWEHAAESQSAANSHSRPANLAESNQLITVPCDHGEGLLQLYGDVWEWTASPYSPYPGFKIPAGPVGEYNGKFMCNQLVLKGGSCVTPADHIRTSYRNFFPADARWQFSGLRLADGID
ncbi:MAG: ergothioneine biosynthesis protein EgtB [Immundisolibacteraceae bacterium]|nr:ergothioneine biosynthesis protein EgtB [Immundisolibacteraceae bacterium]